MGRKRLYSEEEKKQRKRERDAKWRAEHPDYHAKWREENPDYDTKWRAENPDYRAKQYQKNRDKILEQNAKWKAENHDYYKEYKAKYRAKHKDEIAEYRADYNKTPMGRASYLVNAYQQNDKKYNRGECTITSKWIVENIFTKPCHYCGATGWEIMGCDRIDNSLPHTPENVVPCCYECNCKRGRKSYEEFMEMLNSRGIN